MVETLISWKNAVMFIYQKINDTIMILKMFNTVHNLIKREYVITEIKEDLESGELHFGDEVRVIGTFSEYLPFVDIKHILKQSDKFFTTFSHTARIEPIKDIYCGSLYSLDQKNAFADEVIPLFYGIEAKMIEHYTGEMLELKCRIKQIPEIYTDVIKKHDYYVFQKEDNLFIPFGLEVLEVEPYGIVNSFKINTWLLGNLEPYPQFKSTDQTCPSCYYSFMFMKVDPLDWPIKFGCKNLEKIENDPSYDVIQDTLEFRKLDQDEYPYIIFPHSFNLFEIFCPNVDVFQNEKLEYSHAIMKKAIDINISNIFNIGPLPYELVNPKETNLSVDFQYDQRKKFTEQDFNYTDIPEWTCPHYEYNPNWINDLIKRGEDIEEYLKKKEEDKFKIIRKT